MVQINFAQKQVNAKIVYYGPGMSGKTTNLEIVHQRAPQGNRGDLTSISTDGDRTLFFDFMPLDLGTVAGMRTCFQIYTVPGQVYYNSTRKLVLQGVDGIVFVADSSAAMLEENLESLRNLEQNLNEYGKSLAQIPHVIQYNKRDLPDAMPVDQLEAALNAHAAPSFEAVAASGQGVFPTLKALAARVLESIHSGGRTPTPAAPQPPPAPVQQAKTGFYHAPQPQPQQPIAAMRQPQRTLPMAQPQGQQPMHQTGFTPAQAAGQVPRGTHPQQHPQQLHQTGMHAAPQGIHGHPQAPPGYGTMPMQPQPGAMPMQPQMGTPQQLARTGYHAAPPFPAQQQAQAPMMQGAPQPMMMPQTPMQGMHAQQAMQPQPAGGGLRLASPEPAYGQPPGSPAPMMRVDPGAQGQKTAAPRRATPRSAPKPTLEPTPAERSRVAPRATPGHGSRKKALVYTGIFVAVAVGIGALIAKVLGVFI